MRTRRGQGGPGGPASGPEASSPSGRPGAGGALLRRGLPAWLIAGLSAVAELVVGGYKIGTPSLWRDEAATISGSQRPVGAIFSLIRNQDAVHGLYYLLMHAVIAVGGTSATALRVPSLIAMCLTAALTALLGRRLAGAAGLPRPDLAGLLAGLLLVAVPLTTRYAAEARPYALTSLFAVLATYLLLRAVASGRWPWWAGYCAAVLLAGLFTLFAVLLVVAHAVSMFLARPTRSGDGPDTPAVSVPDGKAPDAGAPDAEAADAAASDPRPVSAGTWRSWLLACVVAAIVISPIAYFSAAQSSQLNWVTRPDASTVASLVRDFSGTTLLVPLVALVALIGCLAGRGVRRGEGLTLAVVSLPWLILPPVILIAASFAHPVYVERYVIFCLPALSLLTAAGLVWIAHLTRKALAGRGITKGAPLLSVLPSAVLAIGIAAALIGPQGSIRQATSRPDDLRAVAAVVAANERPGDAIVYIPWDAELVGVAYPAPFRQLNDIEMGTAPIPSATLRGVPASPGVVAARIGRVSRVWTVAWAEPLPGEGPTSADQAMTRALGALRLVHRWTIGSVVLSLYARS
jgi:mannosyltransferase